ncbi:MAG: hypothetical protein P8X42_15505, partial [Calditrichaceae bacterium]
GAQLPNVTIDGKNILSLMEHQPGTESPHEAFYYYNSMDIQAVRSGQWKLHLPHEYLTVVEPGKDGKQGISTTEELQKSLYNFEKDPGEHNNVVSEHPDIVERLTRMAEDFDAQLKQNLRPAGKVG